MKNKALCIYCGSSSGNNEIFINKAVELGRLMATNSIDLVYGGASIGVMGALADSVLEAGGNVYGAMPKHLVDLEVAHPGLTKLFVTNSMHERKALMANLCDGFAALPGGFGTLEELFEAITWSQLKMHRKPVLLLNTDNYYNSLIRFMQELTNKGFVKSAHQDITIVTQEPKELIDIFLNFEA